MRKANKGKGKSSTGQKLYPTVKAILDRLNAFEEEDKE
jgi:hypothetical protein